MTRLLFSCSYDGGHFCGWQSQPNGLSAQDCLEKAFATILGKQTRISASGRTDAGVHAYAQYFHIDIAEDCKLPQEAWIPALNHKLPPSLRVTSLRPIPPRFHARYDAQAKTYEYLIEQAKVLSPFLHGRVWHRPPSFDAGILAAAFAQFQGEHDFRMFAAKRGNEPDPAPADFYMRHIHSATLQEEGSLLRLRVTGNGFLYRMVRMLVGTAHHVAHGKMSQEQLQNMLDEPSHSLKTRYCAPAQGLYLHSVDYGEIT